MQEQLVYYYQGVANLNGKIEVTSFVIESGKCQEMR